MCWKMLAFPSNLSLKCSPSQREQAGCTSSLQVPRGSKVRFIRR